MKAEFITIKTTTDSLTKLRLIAAISGEKQYEIMERVLGEELKRAKRKTSLVQ